MNKTTNDYSSTPVNYFLKFTTVLLLFLTSCSSYQQFQYVTEEFELPTQVYSANFNQAWQAVVDVMNKYDLELQNQEAGIIKTRWIDNTLQLNFSDSFGSSDSVKAAKFKIIMNVVKGFQGSTEVSKITVYKRQMIEKDFLQGWKVIRSDGILEKTILYRLERLLDIDRRLRKIEEEKGKELEAESF